MTLIARKYRVTGRVQGVFFRATTQRQARGLGITGYARNMADGSVEVLAQGTAAQLEALEAYLREGPRMARVDSLTQQPVPPSETLSGFGTS